MASTDLRSCKGLVYAVTGGGGGIGGAIAVRLAQLGAAAVAIADLNDGGMEAKKKEIEAANPECKVMTTIVDVVDGKQVDDWITSIVNEFGRLDGAANIVGGSRKGSQKADYKIAEIDDEYWQFVMDLNMKATMNCMRAQLKVITRPGGSILNCSSGAGLSGLPRQGAYSATKWAIRGLTRTAAVEYGPEGIRVNCLVPGPIDSSPVLRELEAKGMIDLQWMADHSAMRRLGRPDEVAKMSAFLLSPDASYVSGIDAAVDGGGSAIVSYGDWRYKELVKSLPKKED